MRIQHNISALNAYRNYTNNTGSVTKNLEKLSSGYRINRAGDDAAGLAISEKMRAQITGLETAQKNAADGVSLVQTAEGALTEVHSMLNRMVELADQSANGTYDNAVDRMNLQKEVKALKDEIDRIADATNFNGIDLLNGKLSSVVGTKDDIAVVTQTYEKKIDAQKGKFEIDLNGLSVEADAATTFTLKIGTKDITTAALGAGAKDATTLANAVKTACTGDKVTIGGVSYTVKADAGKLTFEMENDPTAGLTDEQMQTGFAVSTSIAGGAADKQSITGTINQATTTITHALKKREAQLAQAEFAFTKDMISEGAQLKIGDKTYTLKVDKDSTLTGPEVIDLTGDKFDPKSESYVDDVAAQITQSAATNTYFTVGYDATAGHITLTQKANLGADQNKLFEKLEDVEKMVSYTGNAGTGLTLQIGDTSAKFNQLQVSIEDCHVKSLKIADVDISTQEGAQAAVDKLKNAINTVSNVRGTLGATQNRLEHTINNLSVTTENMTAAESRIRDVDVAKEMMSYTKNNILVQSAQAMLAQANQTPQGVLQLLQ